MKGNDLNTAIERLVRDSLAALPLGGNLSAGIDAARRQLSQILDDQRLAALAQGVSRLAAEPEKLQQAVEAMMARLAEEAARIDAALRWTIDSTVHHIDELLAELPERMRAALLELGRRGWYLDPEMPITDLWRLEEALRSGDPSIVDHELGEWVEARIEAIESGLRLRYPTRSAILSIAIEAHRRGEYALSIPVLLAQADGICHEVAEGSLFRKQNKRPVLAEYVDRFAIGSLRRAVLAPLEEELPINTSTYATARDPGALNRHEILHGINLDYGTRINGLKALSLLGYLSFALVRVSAEDSGPASGDDANDPQPG